MDTQQKLPGADKMYSEKNIVINPENLAALVLAVGEPFSRIGYDGGYWKPIGKGNRK
jgi:hypothetical protein